MHEDRNEGPPSVMDYALFTLDIYWLALSCLWSHGNAAY